MILLYDHHGIFEMKQHICYYFLTKDLDKLVYFLVLLYLKRSMLWIFWRKLVNEFKVY